MTDLVKVTVDIDQLISVQPDRLSKSKWRFCCNEGDFSQISLIFIHARSCTSTSSTLSWRGAQLKHRDSFSCLRNEIFILLSYRKSWWNVQYFCFVFGKPSVRFLARKPAILTIHRFTVSN